MTDDGESTDGTSADGGVSDDADPGDGPPVDRLGSPEERSYGSTAGPARQGFPPVVNGGRSAWSVIAAAVLALVAGAGAVAGSYLAVGNSPASVVAPVAAVVVELTPDALITFSITVLGDLGSKLALAMSVATTAGLFGVVAGAGATFGREVIDDNPAVTAGCGAVVVGALAFGLTGSVLSAAGATLAVAAVLGVGGTLSWVRAERTPVASVSPVRRGLVGGVATALALGVAGYAIGDGSGGSVGGSEAIAGATDEEGPYPADLLAMAEERSLGVEGMEPLVSEDFYNVDISQIDPDPDPEEWTLTVTGAVEEEVTYEYDDLLEMEAQNHFVTLRCVGEDLNGHKMDTAVWTGVPIADLIEPAEVQGDYVMLRAADGFYEEFPVEALRTGLLAYGMNGEALPRAHGKPARALIPGHWGEINVKWITEIEILEEEAQGYWEERGWHGTGPVNTVAKLHAVNHPSDGRVEVGGHAYAGTRGIERVEVSTDGGDTWTEAELSEELPGQDVWRQWVHRYEADDPHEVVVRAVDGTGTLQPEDRSDAFPSGPTGWVSMEVEP